MPAIVTLEQSINVVVILAVSYVTYSYTVHTTINIPLIATIYDSLLNVQSTRSRFLIAL